MNHVRHYSNDIHYVYCAIFNKSNARYSVTSLYLHLFPPLTGLSPIRVLNLYVLLWECPPLRDGNTSTKLQASSRLAYRNPQLWECPTRSPYSAAEIFHAQSPTKFPFRWWVYPHSEMTVKPNSIVGISPTRSPKFADIVDGITPTQKITAQTHRHPDATYNGPSLFFH